MQATSLLSSLILHTPILSGLVSRIISRWRRTVLRLLSRWYVFDLEEDVEVFLWLLSPLRSSAQIVGDDNDFAYVFQA